jgi:hypothetical protein
MLKIKGLGLLLLFFSQSVETSHFLEAHDCFTDIDARIPVMSAFNVDGDPTGITEEEFMTVLDEVETVYTPVFEALGKTFQVNKLWTNDQVNASAQQSGNNWIINMYGGLARHEHATVDAFRAVACHEIGHHLGGAPKKSGWFGAWASNEGQSDYFATYKCMKKLILEGQAGGLEIASPDLSIYEPEEVAIVEAACSERFTAPVEDEENENGEVGEEDGEVVAETAYTACVRASLSGLSLGRLLGSLRDAERVISLNTPDLTEATKTNDNHPDAQCRADTYFAGSLCNLDFNSELSNTDANIGTCNRLEGFEYGLRSKCWFKPAQ